jgi:hypothetical protein
MVNLEMQANKIKPKQLLAQLRIAIRNRFPILIAGMPGVGKTDIAHQAAFLEKADIYVWHPVVEDPTTFKGMPWVVTKIEPDRKGEVRAYHVPFEDMEVIINAKKPTVVLLDDLGQAPPAVQASAMHLLLARRIGNHQVSPFVTFIACTNRKQDKAGVTFILEPIKGRFTIYELISDLEDWCNWAAENNMPEYLAAFMRWRPEYLDMFEPTSDIVNSPNPRNIARVGLWMNTGELTEDMELATFAACAGTKFAIEYVSFLKIAKSLSLLMLEKILTDPENAEIPDDPAVMYAVCGAIAYRAKKENFGNIVKYANKLKRNKKAEFSILLIRDCFYRNRELIETTEFIKWANKHSDVII